MESLFDARNGAYRDRLRTIQFIAYSSDTERKYI